MGGVAPQYLPVLIFLGVALLISAALLVAVSRRHPQSRSREGLGL